jgi:hypothetical protein
MGEPRGQESSAQRSKVQLTLLCGSKHRQNKAPNRAERLKLHPARLDPISGALLFYSDAGGRADGCQVGVDGFENWSKCCHLVECQLQAGFQKTAHKKSLHSGDKISIWAE